MNVNRRLINLSISFIILLPTVNLSTISMQIASTNTTLDTEWIYVDNSNVCGPWDGTIEHPYQYINDGISNAKEGYIIHVFSGIYCENLTINKTLTLIGENKTSTIIDGMHEDFVIHITDNYVNFTNFTIKNSGGNIGNTGVKIDSNNNLITDCIIYRTKTGVYLDNVCDNEIGNCIFHTNGEGVFLNSASSNNIKNCHFSHNAIGIHLKETNQLEIASSYFYTNGIGCFFNSSSNIEIVNSALCDNNDNQGGLLCSGGSNINVINCNICHNGIGIHLRNTSHVLIDRCDLYWNTHNAINLKKPSKYVTVSNCEIANNFRQGIHVSGSCFYLRNNNVYNNSLYGLRSTDSFCNARYNWWGCAMGPAFTGLRKGDRITLELGKVLFFPWLWKPLNNISSDWETNEVFKQIVIPEDAHQTIEFAETDSDDDGCPDWWEDKWGYDPNVQNGHENLDPDNDGLNNIEECFTDQWGSDPRRKDLFIEFDWVVSEKPDVTNRPASDQLELMKYAFERHNITLHVDDGMLGGGEEIPFMPRFSHGKLRDLYWDYFLHNELNNPRKGVFHYGLICDYGPGAGFAFMGWDHIDSFCISAQMLSGENSRYARERIIVTGSMHETGHTLGLFVDDFGGIDNWGTLSPKYKEFWQYNNYKSCMSYRYTWELMDYSDGTHGINDFNDWDNLDFYFFKNTHLDWPK